MSLVVAQTENENKTKMALTHGGKESGGTNGSEVTTSASKSASKVRWFNNLLPSTGIETPNQVTETSLLIDFKRINTIMSLTQCFQVFACL